MICPRKNCNNDAQISRTYGVLPCLSCQKRDEGAKIHRKRFVHIKQSHRIEAQRDHHKKDLLQPFIRQHPNEEFFRAYPEKIDTFGVREELKKL